jgi:hypothetical protein
MQAVCPGQRPSVDLERQPPVAAAEQSLDGSGTEADRAAESSSADLTDAKLDASVSRPATEPEESTADADESVELLKGWRKPNETPSLPVSGDASKHAP